MGIKTRRNATIRTTTGTETIRVLARLPGGWFRRIDGAGRKVDIHGSCIKQ